MHSTQATVIIADADKAQAQADLSTYQFTTPLSETGEAPATHWMSSGWWYDDELDNIVNVFTWPKQIYFGSDWQAAIEKAGLMVVQPEPVQEPETAPEPETSQTAEQAEGA
jgi:hypothetical protein